MTDTAANTTNRAFGIELEILRPRSLSYAGLAEAIRAAGVECFEEGYNHQTRDHWKVVRDGSLPDNGAELVSPKLFGEDGIQEARKVADALVAKGCTVSTQCGFHVHVDATEFTADQMRKVAVNYLWFETFFDHVMPKSRRGSHNTYVKSNRSRFGGYGTQALNAGIMTLTSPSAATSMGQTIGAHEAVIRAFCQGDRYFKLNLTAWTRQGSIEFRQHSGTVEADKIENWVRLTVAFIEKSKISKPRPRKVVREWTAAEEMHLFFSMFSVPEATRKFYMQRRKDIAANDREMAKRQANPAAYGQPVVAAIQARIERVSNFRRPQHGVLHALRGALARLNRAIEAGNAEHVVFEVNYAVRNRLVPAAVAGQAQA